MFYRSAPVSVGLLLFAIAGCVNQSQEAAISELGDFKIDGVAYNCNNPEMDRLADRVGWK